jgi:8-oxo-dGTP diphosphatase
MPQVKSAVKALIQYRGKYLIIKEALRKGEIWDLPGGKIEYGESPQQALHREVKEELDLQVKIIQSIGVWYFYSLNSKTQVICHTFMCEPIGEVDIDLSKNPADEEITKWQWLTLDEILHSKKIVIAESLRELLQERLMSSAS